MGVFGPGRDDNDTAWDYRSSVFDLVIEKIETGLKSTDALVVRAAAGILSDLGDLLFPDIKEDHYVIAIECLENIHDLVVFDDAAQENEKFDLIDSEIDKLKTLREEWKEYQKTTGPI